MSNSRYYYEDTDRRPRSYSTDLYTRSSSPPRRSHSNTRSAYDHDVRELERYSRQRQHAEKRHEEKRLDGVVGREGKDIAATVLGAVVGGWLAHEAAGGKKPARTIAGAVLGGLAGNAIEHWHLKKVQLREERRR